MARKMYKTERFRITRPPHEQQPGEPNSAYKLFQAYLMAEGKTTLVDLAGQYEYQVSTLQSYCQKYKWQERVVMVRGNQLHGVDHLSLSADEMPMDEEIAQGQASEIDPAMARVVGAEEVMASGYQNTCNLHRQLLRHAEDAVAKVKTTGLSMAELKALISMVNDLQALKIATAKDLLSLEELAAALTQIRRGKK